MASSEGGSVIACHSVDEWRQHISGGDGSKKLPWQVLVAKLRLHSQATVRATQQVIVDFTASWCGPCRVIAPVLSDWAKKFVDVKFLKVDVDEMKDIAKEWAVEAMPTFVFLKAGKEIDRLVGARKEELHSKIIHHMTGANNA